MGMLDICSNASYWRGLDYYETKKVKQVKKIGKYEYEAIVSGTEDYHVHLDVDHPKKSTCTCPHANGKAIICKHKVAVFFTVFPSEAKKATQTRDYYYKEQEEKEQRFLKEMKEKRKLVQKYVDSLSEQEVRNLLVNRMVNELVADYNERDDFYDRYY